MQSLSSHSPIDTVSVTPLESPGVATLVELLQLRATEQPEKLLYRFLASGEEEVDTLNYGELHLRAQKVAQKLRDRVASGERALLLYPSGLEFIVAFFGCLYAGVIAVPAYPPRRNQKLDRLESIVQDAAPAVMLTTTSSLQQWQEQWLSEPMFRSLDCLATDGFVPGEDTVEADPEPAISAQSLAFLQYTSGSTGTPKGVMVSHGNLLHNCGLVQRASGANKDSHVVLWLPLYHDMGLISGILSTLFTGCSATLMSPVAFLQKPMRWLQAISDYQATISGAPDFAYRLCIDRIRPEQKAHLDLSSWRIAFNGAEPLRADTLDAFSAAFADCDFSPQSWMPCYGLAEATLGVSWATLDSEPKRILVSQLGLAEGRAEPVAVTPETTTLQTTTSSSQALVSSGIPPKDWNVRIVNPETRQLCNEGEIGEIWLRGPSVAQGYWGHPDLSEETFHAYLTDSQRQDSQEQSKRPYLRTGDFGFLDADGELFVTGRLKDVIIIRGRNHYPQDIELSVEKSHPGLRTSGGAAFSIDVDGTEKLVVVQEVERTYVRKLDARKPDIRKLNSKEIVKAIMEAVAREHELAIHTIVLLKPGSIPKTSSGKIQRRACQQQLIDGVLQKVVLTWSVDDVSAPVKPLEFSLLYFSSNEAEFKDNKYRLLLEGAKFADNNNFHAVWIPERHFHPFGGLYPEPSILGGVLGALTENIRIRPGSVVLPLQNPVRVAEQWSVVDNLSNGRVDISFARGWNPNDFVLAPDNYVDRTQVMFEGVETIQKLWRGDAISGPNGNGKETEIKIYPLPKQSELPVWITCSGGKQRFIEAGAMGANILTALLFQPIEDLAEKIGLYREARAQNGYDPDAGCVSLMMHTFVGEDIEFVRDRVRQPFIDYLESSINLWRNESQNLEALTSTEKEKILEYAFERYFQTTALFGTPDSCLAMVARLKAIGVDEIACLIDFGIEAESVLSNLEYLNRLRKKANAFNPETHRAKQQSEVNSKQEKPEASHFNTLQETMIQYIADSLQIDCREIEPDKSFFSLGIDSLKGIELIEALSQKFEIEISPASLFEYPTIAQLSEYLSTLHQFEASFQPEDQQRSPETESTQGNWVEVEL